MKRQAYTIFIITICLLLNNLTMGETMARNSIRKNFLILAKEKAWVTLSDISGLIVYSFSKIKKEVFCRPNNENISWAALLNDASKIAFVISKNSFLDRLIIINSDGSDLNEVAKIYKVNGGISWSPDGNNVAFVGKLEERSEPEFDKQDPSTWSPRYNSLYINNFQTKKIDLLVKDGVSKITTQAWSVDSKKICYENINHDILIYDIETKISKKIINGTGTKWNPAGGSYPSWSADGNLIAYQDIKSENYYLISPINLNTELLIKNKESLGKVLRFIGKVKGALLWSPDSKFLLYGRSYGIDGEDTVPFIMELATKREEKLSRDICGLQSFAGRK
jgi:hypothetical protein